MGFVWYIRCHILMVAPEALLLFVSLVAVRRKEADYFMIQLVSIGLVLVFGFVVQLYYLGFLPVHLLTRYAVHGMILPQIVIQTFALGKRFAILTKERLALHNALLHASEKYSQSLIKTLEAERKRLSAEFHDSIGQNLLVIRNRLLLMIKKLPPSISPPLEALADLTSETLDEIREISQNLRPTTLDTIGLTASLHNMMQRLVRATEIEIQFDCPQNIDEMVIKDLEINVYRILQELMNNVLKHSKARRVRVTVVPKDHALRLVVEDDGVGFDRNKLDTIAVSGMNSIRERVRILKGELTINSTPNQGTMVQIKIPCPPPV
jgi:signal transduction histidine kinase